MGLVKDVVAPIEPITPTYASSVFFFIIIGVISWVSEPAT